jgi:predicted dehydrogenase
MLIEKPISDRLSAELEALRDEVLESGVVTRVAYNLRFLGAIERIRTVLEGGELGQLLFARIEVGQWLPDWRPKRPISETYSASSQRGGGVALDLSHELDYMLLLFGAPVDWSVRLSATGVLGIDAPDVFDGVYSFADGFSASVHMDYLERLARRRIRIVGSDGVLECDIVGRSMTVRLNDAEPALIDDEALFDVARTYSEEHRSFFAQVAGVPVQTALPDLDAAIDVLRLIEAPRPTDTDGAFA